MAQQGDEIVVQTTAAQVQDAILGALAVAEFKPGPANALDLEGVDMAPFRTKKQQARWERSQSRRRGSGYEQKNGALKLADFELKYELLGVGGTFDQSVAEVKAVIPIKTKKKQYELEVTGSAALVGSYSLKPSLYGALEIGVNGDWWPPNKWVSVDVDYAKASAKLKAEFEAGLELDIKAEVGGGEALDEEGNEAAKDNPAESGSEEFSFSSMSFKGPTVSGIPTTFEVELVAECGLAAYGTVQGTASGGLKFDGEAGIVYDGDDWSTILDLNFEKRYSVSFNLGGGVEAKCAVGPEVMWKFAEVGGPHITFEAAVVGAIEYQTECPPPEEIGAATPPNGKLTKKVAVGYESKAGIGVEFCGIELGWETTLAEQEWPLYESETKAPGVGYCASACTNGLQDNDETDQDCGGAPHSKKKPLCPGCTADDNCKLHLDCANGLQCIGGKCTAVNCKDGKQGSAEMGIDCGEKCGIGCPLDNPCLGPADCASANCIGGKCTQPSCANGIQDNAESGLDCGGACPKCQGGAACKSDDDCDSGACLPFNPKLDWDNNRFCGPPQCSLLQWKALFNGKTDETLGESSKDCGGPCATGPIPAQACNGSYCGNDLPRCPQGKACNKELDCQTGNCKADGTCGGSRCTDGKKNDAETDVDCGGACLQKCAAAKGCKQHHDCSSTLKCAGEDGTKTCIDHCKTGKADFGEPDVDCGILCPNKCANGKHCGVHGDCDAQSACTHEIFYGDFCKVVCGNGEKDTAEADVDCGIACPKKCDKDKTCNVDADCFTGSCGYWDGAKMGAKYPFTKKTCTEPCGNGRKDGKESGADCGTACAPMLCNINQTCYVHADCKNGYCAPDGKCRIPTCKDKWHNQGEGDVDCGKVCKEDGQLCKKGQKCGTDDDCKEGACEGGICIGNPCEDGKKQPYESDVDCGGGKAPWLCYPCQKGQKCIDNKHCKSNQCVAGVCIYEPCTDKIQSPGEADVDCGGTCSTKCAFDQKCSKGSDCQTGFCDGFHCVKSACDNKVQDAGESDTDCGGPCATKCADAKACKTGGDCKSGICNAKTHACAATTCEDGAKSSGETDIDCGGSCATKCAEKQGCKAGGDCASKVCNGAVCVAGTCQDKQMNGSETAVDCGGACATKCSTGAACKVSGDCTSSICSKAGVCVLNHCDDGDQSVGETGPDCGGVCKTKCLVGQGCKIADDCENGLCAVAKGVCAADACGDGIKNGTEAGVDCGAVPAGFCKVDADCPSGKCWLTAAGDKGMCMPMCGGVCEGKACIDDPIFWTQGGSPCAPGLYCGSSTSQMCSKSSCFTKKKDGDETDTDCGGSCTKCALAKSCKINGDCASGHCAATSLVCVANACANEVKDSGEVEVDCGGTCGGCKKATPCKDDSVCDAAFKCLAGVAGEPTYCGCPYGMDQVLTKDKDGTESWSCAWDLPVWGIEEPSPYNTWDNGVKVQDAKGTVVWSTYLTALDTRTGLEWLTIVDQPTGLPLPCSDYSKVAFLGGKTGWRTATRQELFSATDWTRSTAMFDTLWISFGTTPSVVAMYTSTPIFGTSPLQYFKFGPTMSEGAQSEWTLEHGTGYPCVRSTKSFTLPKDRFVVDAAADTVSDKLTGLTWQRTVAATPVTHDDASAACKALGGLWRMPKLREMASLVIQSPAPVKIDAKAFPNTPKGTYWGLSGKNGSADTFVMLLTNFSTGSAYRKSKGPYAASLKSEVNLARCVK